MQLSPCTRYLSPSYTQFTCSCPHTLDTYHLAIPSTHAVVHLGYEAEEELSTVIKEEVSEEVLSHHWFSGIRKAVLLPLQTIFATVFLYLLLLPLHVCVMCIIYTYTHVIVCIHAHVGCKDLGMKIVHLLYCSKHLLYWLEAFGRVIEYRYVDFGHHGEKRH